MLPKRKKVKIPSSWEKIDKTKITIRKATENDIDGIFNVASSVGTHNKDPLAGYLMDDYDSDPEGYKKKLLEAINTTEYFYVAEYTDENHKAIVGFTFGYDRDNWMKKDPAWFKDSMFRPDFNKSNLERFVMLEKIAVLDHLKRNGVGGMLSRQMIKDMKENETYNIFEEVIIAPVPNLPSVLFKKKRAMKLTGVRYEKSDTGYFTTLTYHKELKKPPKT